VKIWGSAALAKLPQFEKAIEALERECREFINWGGLDRGLVTFLATKFYSFHAGFQKQQQVQVSLGDSKVVKFVSKEQFAKIEKQGAVALSQRDRAALAGRPKPNNCEVCGQSGVPIFWDHDHTSGHFRGWICRDCNFALGFARDSVERLEKLIVYLKQPTTAPVLTAEFGPAHFGHISPLPLQARGKRRKRKRWRRRRIAREEAAG
jgi:hypothetical protein